MSIQKMRQILINIIPVKGWRTWLSYNYGWFPKNFVQPDVKISSIRKLKLGGNVYIGGGGASLHCEGGLTIRNGEPKYLVRELFAKRYPTLDIPTKIPMPRAMNQWLKDYKVSRPEFIPNCTENMTGDQKWLCWCLEQFLNMHEEV